MLSCDDLANLAGRHSEQLGSRRIRYYRCRNRDLFTTFPARSSCSHARRIVGPSWWKHLLLLGDVDSIATNYDVSEFGDHAGIEGWGAPAFRYDDVDLLADPPTATKGMLPIVFSINCASGFFDQETDFLEDMKGNRTANTAAWSASDARNFAEAVLLRKGGAVAVVARRASAYAFHNETLADGLFGALFPDYPTFDAAAPTSGAQSLGNVLDWAKLYHAVQWAGDPLVKYVYEEFNLLGDPSMRVRRLPR